MLTKEQREKKEALREQLYTVESDIEASFLDAIDALDDHIDWEQMEDDVENDRLPLVLALLSTVVLAHAFNGFLQSLTNGYIALGSTVADQIGEIDTPAGTRVKPTFDIASAAVNEKFANYRGQMITDLTLDFQRSIRDILIQNINAGFDIKQNAKTIVESIRGSIGLTARQEQAVQNFKRMLEERPMSALSRTLRDRRFDSTLLSTAQREAGLTKEQIDQMVRAYRKKYLAYRARTIARTEGVRLLNMATAQLWDDLVEKGMVDPDRVKRYWDDLGDSKVRDWHRTVKYINADGVKIHQPFQTELGPLMYPGDPTGTAANVVNCRCYVTYKIV